MLQLCSIIIRHLHTTRSIEQKSDCLAAFHGNKTVSRFSLRSFAEKCLKETTLTVASLAATLKKIQIVHISLP